MAVLVAQPALLGEQRQRETRSEAEDEAAVADDMVRYRRLDRDVERVMQVDQLDPGAHADVLGQRGRLAHHELGRRDGVDAADIGRLAVVLADIGDAETELVGQDDFVDVLFVCSRRAGVRAKAVGENTEFHERSRGSRTAQ